MNKVNEILTEWTYQLESGYPKKDEDYIVLQNILQESTDFDQSKIHQIVDRARGLQEDEVPIENIGFVSDNPNSKQDDFADLLKSLKDGPENKITKHDQFSLLAEYTKDHYFKSSHMPVSLPAKFSIRDINDHIKEGRYTLGDKKTGLISRYSSPGIAAEAVIFTYLNAEYGMNIQHVESQQPGKDGEDGNITYEVKTTTKSSINLLLNTTFFTDDPNKYYIFAKRDQPGYEFTMFDPVYIISSQLLRRISIGEDIYNEMQQSGNKSSKILQQQIQAGLKQLDFENQLIASITTGETGEFQKQFDIGNNISIVFKMWIQPKKF